MFAVPIINISSKGSRESKQADVSSIILFIFIGYTVRSLGQ